MKKYLNYVKGALALILVSVLLSGIYTVKETEQVVIKQFGAVKGAAVTTAGLHFKWPILQSATYLPKNILEWDGGGAQFNTNDQRYIYVDTFARWQIVDPIKFLLSVNNLESAQHRLSDVMNAATKSVVVDHDLIEVVRNTNRSMDTFVAMESDIAHIGEVKLGRSKLMEAILQQARQSTEKFGIALSDVKAKRVNYIDDVRVKVYAKMSKERDSVAAMYLSEGKGESARIIGDMNKQLLEITSGAARDAKEIVGKAEGDATRILAQAAKDPEFYEFWQTLELYKASIGKGDKLYLSTNNRLFKTMRDKLGQ
jgi:membrane protease subunit HflC